MIASEITKLDCFAILHMRGAIAVPARPARFETTMIVEKPSINEAILSWCIWTKERNLWLDGLTHSPESTKTELHFSFWIKYFLSLLIKSLFQSKAKLAEVAILVS